MTSLNTSLYAGLAFGDQARQPYAAQLRAQEEQVASQIRASISPVPGSKITAQYEYRVAADGTLYPTQTQIKTESFGPVNVPEKVTGKTQREEREENGFLRQSRNRQPRFGDFTPVRASLSPIDELRLFGQGANAALGEATSDVTDASPESPAPANALTTAQAQEADGTPIQVEVLPPQSEAEAANDNKLAAPVTSLTAQAQNRVAYLYARNNDVVYNVTPLSTLAA